MDCNQTEAAPEKFRAAMGTQNDGKIPNIWKYCSQRVFQSCGFSPVNIGKFMDGGWPKLVRMEEDRGGTGAGTIGREGVPVTGGAASDSWVTDGPPPVWSTSPRPSGPWRSPRAGSRGGRCWGIAAPLGGAVAHSTTTVDSSFVKRASRSGFQ